MPRRSENFHDKEFRCKCRHRAPWLPECKQKFVPNELIAIMQDVRDHFGAAVTVHSGHRCKAYNKHVGGAKRSKHMKAIACDFTVDGVTPNEVAEYLLAKYPNQYGIGRYNTFTHIDVRKRRARWDNRR